MTWVIDIDGVITSNPDFFKWWTYQLKKRGNKSIIHIVSSRNPSRRNETEKELEYWSIKYDYLHTMDEILDRDWLTQCKWKILKVGEIKPQVWIDNDFKMYSRVFNLDLDTLLPYVERIQI